MKYLIGLFLILFATINSVAQIGPMLPGPGNFASGGSSFTNTLSITSDDGTKSATRTQGTGTSQRIMTFNFWYRTVDRSNATTVISSVNAGLDVIVYAASQNAIVLILGSGANGICTSSSAIAADNTYYQVTVQIDTDKGTIANGCKILIDNVDTTTVVVPVTINYDTS